MKHQVLGTECTKKHTRPQVLTHMMKQLRMKLRDWPRVAQCVMFVLLALLAPGPSGADADDGAAGDEGREWYSPKVIMSMVEEEPMAPPCTHHVDIELQSFDPADGYLELHAGSRMLRRVLDPPPAEIYTVYNSVYSCQPPAPRCGGSYTAKLFRFSSPEPVAVSTIEWSLLPGAAVAAEVIHECERAFVSQSVCLTSQSPRAHTQTHSPPRRSWGLGAVAARPPCLRTLRAKCGRSTAAVWCSSPAFPRRTPI